MHVNVYRRCTPRDEVILTAIFIAVYNVDDIHVKRIDVAVNTIAERSNSRHFTCSTVYGHRQGWPGWSRH